MRKEYDLDSSDSSYDGTTGGRPVLYAGETWDFPTFTNDAGLIGFDLVLHTGTDPDNLANRVSTIRRVADPAARDTDLQIPSKKSGTATVNASVRAVFKFGNGPWATSGTPATKTTGSVVVPGINATASVAAANANGLVIAGGGTTIAIAQASGTTPGAMIVGAQTMPTGTKAFDSITLVTKLALTEGGTGGSSKAGALTNLLPSQAGQTGKFLQSTGTAGSEAWATATGTGIPPSSTTFSPADPLIFGGGGDGDLASGFGTLHLDSGATPGDIFFRNVTIGASDLIVTNGHRLFISGTLDISAASSGAIAMTALLTGSGGATAAVAGSGGTGGAGGTGLSDTGGNLGFMGSGGAGSNGVSSGAAANGTAGNPYSGGGTNGGSGGTGGAGGHGTTTSTGGSGALGGVRNPVSTYIVGKDMGIKIVAGSYTRIGGGAGGGGGGGAGGGSAHTGGGGGGAGGGVLCIMANTIARGTNTNTGIFSVRGGDGANGAAGALSAAGGGAGGGGGGGGWIMLGFKTLTGSSIPNAIDYSGGAGGNGANGNTGTSVTGGDGGGSGGSGLLCIYDMNNGTTVIQPVAGSAGTAHSGTTGGAGAAANVQRSAI